MDSVLGTDRFELEVGGLSRTDLQDALDANGVPLNTYAEILLENPVFDLRAREDVVLTERTVGALGLAGGGSMSRVLAAAQEQGLHVCPPDTGPYLRLALPDQPQAPDSMLRVGRAPSGSLQVAAAPLSEDDEYPKGFYLRVVDGTSWLRGYRCDDQHLWSPEDRIVFRVSALPG